MDGKKIRNFSIIAHIDHGKSTLADRLIESTKKGGERWETMDRFLDNMDLEKERGITVKAQAVALNYRGEDGEEYLFNLVDTPGHVDFSYEVDRSLASCEGAILVVDASQGVQAQTLATVYRALEHNLSIVCVLNKIDLPHADIVGTKEEIESIIGIDTSDALEISAKTGEGVDKLLSAIAEKIPPPKGLADLPPTALIFDSWFDPYQGVVLLIRVIDGTFSKRDRIYLKHSGGEYEILKLALNAPFFKEIDQIYAGQIGMLYSGIKTIRDVKVGDTVVLASAKDTPKLDGYREVVPMVFCGIFPVDSKDYQNLKDALEKLSLNDSSFVYQAESSGALGLGYRCGFLGLLHRDIIQQRLEREFELDLISTAPSVTYRVKLPSGECQEISNPWELPPASEYQYLEEPIMSLTIHLPDKFLGNIMKLCSARRGRQTDLKYLTEKRVQINYHMPLSEMVYDFYDKLKSLSEGHASMDYEYSDYQRGDLVKLDILLNGSRVDALSLICHRSNAYFKGRELVGKLAKVIERSQFDIAIQGAIGGKIIARETVKALRKNVLAKCYGGDITRKRKLLEKQKAGKKRMKMVGNIELPQEAFLAVLSGDD